VYPLERSFTYNLWLCAVFMYRRSVSNYVGLCRITVGASRIVAVCMFANSTTRDDYRTGRHVLLWHATPRHHHDEQEKHYARKLQTSGDLQ
jgi:hypothetical protein